MLTSSCDRVWLESCNGCVLYLAVSSQNEGKRGKRVLACCVFGGSVCVRVVYSGNLFVDDCLLNSAIIFQFLKVDFYQTRRGVSCACTWVHHKQPFVWHGRAGFAAPG